MSKDMVPKILETLQADLADKRLSSEVLQKAAEKLTNGTATHLDTHAVGLEHGKVLASSLKENISVGILPDGKMYFNIADRILPTTMLDSHKLIINYAVDVQNLLNKRAGLGIKGVRPEPNMDRIRGLVNKAAEAEKYEDVEFLILDSVENYCMSSVDAFMKFNAEYHLKAGLRPVIMRSTVGKCCDFCQKLVGIYDYEAVKDTGNIVFQRHRKCDCLVIYDPNNGIKGQNVHDKRDVSTQDVETLKKRIEFSKMEVSHKNQLLKNVATEKAMEMGYMPVPQERVVGTLRKDSEEWIKTLSEEEKNAITKYTFNGVDKDGEKFYRKLNGFLEGKYSAKNQKENGILLEYTDNIRNGLLKNNLDKDLIVYRSDGAPDQKEGVINQFLSTSVTQRGTFGGEPNMAIIVPKGTQGAYIENLSHKDYKYQREFLLNSGVKLKKLDVPNINLYIVEK